MSRYTPRYPTNAIKSTTPDQISLPRIRQGIRFPSKELPNTMPSLANAYICAHVDGVPEPMHDNLLSKCRIVFEKRSRIHSCSLIQLSSSSKIGGSFYELPLICRLTCPLLLALFGAVGYAEFGPFSLAGV